MTVVSVLTLLLLSSLTLALNNLSSRFVQVRQARVPQDLPKIRACRSTMMSTGGQRQLASAIKFLNATSLAQGKVDCILVQSRIPPYPVLGTADVKIRQDEAFVINVFVRDDQRGKGIGKKLMEGVIETVDPKPSFPLRLDVQTQNQPAFRLYENLGFEARGLNKATLALSTITGVDLQVRMEKKSI